MKGEHLTPTQILIDSRKVVEAGWCIRASARTAKGIPCEWDEAKAASWCSTGAMLHVVSMFAPAHFHALNFLREAVGQHAIVAWNDAPGRTKEEVLAAFDTAIEISVAKAQERSRMVVHGT